MDERLVEEFRRIAGSENVLSEPIKLLTYECDALPHLRETPALVVLPGSAAEVQAVVRLCGKEGVPFVARGHGTGLSGGALPVPGGVVISLARLNRVLDVDIPNRRVTVEPGVTNLEITRQVAPSGYYYAPDPSSQQVCSIGGNVAENSGGSSTASRCTTFSRWKRCCRAASWCRSAARCPMPRGLICSG
jgi:glycolate oxidase